MFEQALRELVAATRAEYGIFCDYEGEAIALVFDGADDYDVRVVGAQLEKVIGFAQEAVARTGQSERLQVCLRTDRRELIVEALPGHYYVVLAVPLTVIEPVVRRGLKELGDRFIREL